MAITRSKKQELLDSYSERLGRASVMIWTENKGISVPRIQALRSELRQTSAEAVVVKNTLMRLALEKAGLPYDEEMMSGASIVTFIYDDIAPAAKAVSTFASKADKLAIKGGLVDGKLIGVDQVDELTRLPSREELLSRVVGGMQAPISGLVGTLAAVVRGVVNVLDARRKQLEEAA